MRGIEALQRNRVPFHCISVITADAMEQPERMYRFFRDHGINDVGFNVEEKEGRNQYIVFNGRLKHGGEI